MIVALLTCWQVAYAAHASAGRMLVNTAVCPHLGWPGVNARPTDVSGELSFARLALQSGMVRRRCACPVGEQPGLYASCAEMVQRGLR